MRALSGVDATFLHLETEQTPMHIASLSLFDLPPGYRRDFHAAVKRELGRRLHLVPVCWRRPRIEPPRRHLNEPYLVTDSSVPMRAIIQLAWLNGMSALVPKMA
jgi:diacylglycerol O-acyltransferase